MTYILEFKSNAGLNKRLDYSNNPIKQNHYIDSEHSANREVVLSLKLQYHYTHSVLPSESVCMSVCVCVLHSQDGVCACVSGILMKQSGPIHLFGVEKAPYWP